MIIQKQEYNEAEYIGDIQENRVGIDKANIDFIATLLTSNLYSNPLESFLRETVSNAWDAQVEAGNTEEYIILLIEYLEDKRLYKLSIRDYGTGISPEKFDTIYRYIGSSTKRDTNDYIGGFGIGKYAALSLADSANIVSYYNGKKYFYILYKNGTGINIDRLSINNTDAPNGVEVSVTANNINSLDTALAKLAFFEKLHVEFQGFDSYMSRNITNNFNSRQNLEYKHFCSSNISGLQSYYSTNYIKIGKVIYEYKDPQDFIRNSGAILSFDVGELDITPNREQIQYTQRSVNAIEKKLALAEAEYKELIKSTCAERFENSSIQDIVSKICNHGNYYLLDGFPLRVSIRNLISLEVFKVDGITIPSTVLNCILMFGHYLFKKSDLQFFTRNGTDSKEITLKVFTSRNIYVQKDSRLNQYTKDWYDSLNANRPYTVIKNPREFIKYCLMCHIPKACIKFYIEHANIKEISNTLVPQSYINTWKDAFKSSSKKKLSDDLITYRSYIGLDNPYHCLRTRVADLFRCKNTIIYGTNTKEDIKYRELSTILRSRSSIKVCTFPKEIIPALNGHKNFISIEDYTTKYNRILSRWATAYVLFEKCSCYYNKLKYSYYYSKRRTAYNNYINTVGINGCGSGLGKELIELYKNKRWLDYSSIDKCIITEDEEKASIIYEELSRKKEDILMEYMVKHYNLKSLNSINRIKSLVKMNNNIKLKLEEHESI